MATKTNPDDRLSIPEYTLGLEAQCASLQTENGRLRAALEDIQRNVTSLADKPVPRISEDARWYFQRIRDDCRAALEGRPT